VPVPEQVRKGNELSMAPNMTLDGDRDSGLVSGDERALTCYESISEFKFQEKKRVLAGSVWPRALRTNYSVQASL
jgi:hypothetical protein